MIHMTLPVIATLYLDNTNQWEIVGFDKRNKALEHIKTGRLKFAPGLPYKIKPVIIHNNFKNAQTNQGFLVMNSPNAPFSGVTFARSDPMILLTHVDLKYEF